jgi:hypothetical protein
MDEILYQKCTTIAQLLVKILMDDDLSEEQILDTVKEARETFKEF